MTVDELINALSKFPLEARVMVHDACPIDACEPRLHQVTEEDAAMSGDCEDIEGEHVVLIGRH